MSNNKNRVEGMIAKRRDNAPSFVTVNLSIKVDSFTQFLEENESNGWVNLQVKKRDDGSHYAELDTWKPTGRGSNDLP